MSSALLPFAKCSIFGAFCVGQKGQNQPHYIKQMSIGILHLNKTFHSGPFVTANFDIIFKSYRLVLQGKRLKDQGVRPNFVTRCNTCSATCYNRKALNYKQLALSDLTIAGFLGRESSWENRTVLFSPMHYALGRALGGARLGFTGALGPVRSLPALMYFTYCIFLLYTFPIVLYVTVLQKVNSPIKIKYLRHVTQVCYVLSKKGTSVTSVTNIEKICKDALQGLRL